jgi:hypothetical protein
LEFALPGVQFMQEVVNRLPVGSIRQRLFHQSAESAQVAFESA